MAVVEDREGKRELVRRLSHDDRFAERVLKHSVRTLGEGLASKARQSLRRPETGARPSDEQNPGYVSIRHGSE
jgi:hypothetical protein